MKYALSLILACLLAACTLSSGGRDSAPAATPPDTGSAPLVVAWAVNGDLFVWNSADPQPRRIASGGVIRPFVAPDGANVAYLRGPEGEPRSLWISDTRGATERQLLDAQTLAAGESARWLLQVVWSLDSRTLYFNTRVSTALGESEFPVPADDLWSVDPQTGTRARLLGDGAGGQIVPSPDGQRLALAAAGDYSGEMPGAIRFYHLANRQIEGQPFEFPAVATASESRWVARPQWLPDGSGVQVAIPPRDLVYGSGPETALWWLPVGGHPEQIGAVDADFFTLPAFSADGSWIVYAPRRAAPDQNALALVLARADGAEPTTIFEGDITSLVFAGWLPTGNRFLAQQGGALWLAGPDLPPVAFPAEAVNVIDVVWADPATVVYSAESQGAFVLYFTLLDVPTAPHLIAQIEAYPFFDARLP